MIGIYVTELDYNIKSSIKLSLKKIFYMKSFYDFSSILFI